MNEQPIKIVFLNETNVIVNTDNLNFSKNGREINLSEMIQKRIDTIASIECEKTGKKINSFFMEDEYFNTVIITYEDFENNDFRILKNYKSETFELNGKTLNYYDMLTELNLMKGHI